LGIRIDQAEMPGQCSALALGGWMFGTPCLSIAIETRVADAVVVSSDTVAFFYW
jgi:hypothetical protein